jgi:hypothetical protein
MKKMLAVMMILMVSVGCWAAHAFAQTWTWQDPISVSTPVTEIAADGASGGIYGIDATGLVVPMLDVQTVAGTDALLGNLSPINDLVFGSGGDLHAVSDGAVMRVNTPPPLSYTPLLYQPRIPLDDAKGAYKHVTSGVNGRLYVLYQAESGRQYLLTGLPPVIQGVINVGMTPQTLNMKSKGNWVSCRIDFAEGYKGGDADVSSIKIVRLEIPGFTPVDYDIFRAPGSPVTIGPGRLMVKFWNYDKANPDNPQSLSKQLSAMLDDAGKGKYDVTATVMLRMKEGPHKGEWLAGTATFDALKPTGK